MGWGRANRRTHRGPERGSKREKLRKRFIHRTFGDPVIASYLNKRPFFPFWEYLVVFIDTIIQNFYFVLIMERDRQSITDRHTLSH